ncbi:hypothetical protein GCM10018966_024750 [Streptomyces yanii]
MRTTHQFVPVVPPPEGGIGHGAELIALADRPVIGRPGQSVSLVAAPPKTHRAGLDLVTEGRELGRLGVRLRRARTVTGSLAYLPRDAQDEGDAT